LAAKESRLELYEPGTVVVAIYGLEAAGIRGTASIIEKRCTISQACMAFSDFKGVDNEFFYYWYLHNGPLIGIRFAQGTKQQNLSSEIIGSLPICFPSLAEQRKIAKILAVQDRVIELLNRKIEQLKQLKKYYLRKMFPQHAKTVPEVRFPGFTGAWERKRLDDVFSEHTEKGHPELPALTIVQGGGTIKRDESERKLHYDKNYLSNYKVVDKGDFIVHLRSFEGGLEVATTRGLISPAYNVFRGKASDPRFYYAYFRSPEFIHGDLTPHVYGIRDGRSIDIDGLKSIRIPYAPLAEQKAVGNFIATVDNQIALHQRKHDEEVRKKKALMQLLLTGIVRV
jgi:type I restriction enzyme S subunit